MKGIFHDWLYRGVLRIFAKNQVLFTFIHSPLPHDFLISLSSQLRVIFYHNNTAISQLVAVVLPTTAAPLLTLPTRKLSAHANRTLIRYRIMASQAPSNCGWPNEEAGARNRFVTMPSEILLKIVSQLPSKYFLDLVQTCRMLRNFIKINASRICNEKIGQNSNSRRSFFRPSCIQGGSFLQVQK